MREAACGFGIVAAHHPDRFRLNGFFGGGLADHDIASRSAKLYRTPALCASRSKHPAQIVRQRLSTTVVHAASGVMLKVTTVGRPHFWQYWPSNFAMHECSSAQAINNHAERYRWPRPFLSFGSAMRVRYSFNPSADATPAVARMSLAKCRA